MKMYLDRSISFAEYLGLIDGLLAEGKTTGPKQSEAMFNYGRLNRQRMWRLEKTLELEPETVMMAASNERKIIWLVLTEGWCGDAAQNIPV
ncbi:MAG TPA: thioredoxin family protein, partial [Pyrinomonadaceae bacterium]|nr:thioredoxin family protein [Pyrinomonadaceae bacterium]